MGRRRNYQRQHSLTYILQSAMVDFDVKEWVLSADSVSNWYAEGKRGEALPEIIRYSYLGTQELATPEAEQADPLYPLYYVTMLMPQILGGVMGALVKAGIYSTAMGSAFTGLLLGGGGSISDMIILISEYGLREWFKLFIIEGLADVGLAEVVSVITPWAVEAAVFSFLAYQLSLGTQLLHIRNHWNKFVDAVEKAKETVDTEVDDDGKYKYKGYKVSGWKVIFEMNQSTSFTNTEDLKRYVTKVGQQFNKGEAAKLGSQALKFSLVEGTTELIPETEEE